MHPPAPEVADQRAPTCPLPNCWATSAGAVAPATSRHLGKDDGARLDVADAAEGLERRHRGQPLALFVLGLPQSDPWLQPAFAREHQAILLARPESASGRFR